jgi:hypothetical protein
MPTTSTIEPPKRILSANLTAKHLRVSRQTFEKYQRRGLLKADYVSDAGSFYDFERLPALAEAINASRNQHSRHLAATV